MRRLLIFISLGLLLVSCSDKALDICELRVEVNSVTGSRCRLTVAAMNKKAYYCYVQLSRQEKLYNASPEEIVNHEIAWMESSYKYFSEGSFTDVFCYQGSRQFAMTSLSPDADYKFVVFQMNPKTHQLIGEPVVKEYHTKPIPQRNISFDVQVTAEKITVTPSGDEVTYLWDYETTEYVEGEYFLSSLYLYDLVGMYDEYGFLDSMLSFGPDEWFFSEDKHFQTGVEYTLAIAGCEGAEFTTTPMSMRFICHDGGTVEIVSPLSENTID